MLTYDAFSFIQVTFILFFVLGFAAALLGYASPGGGATTPAGLEPHADAAEAS